MRANTHGTQNGHGNKCGNILVFVLSGLKLLLYIDLGYQSFKKKVIYYCG